MTLTNSSPFQHIAQNRYMDQHMDHWTVKILPGEFYASHDDDMIVTTLGSCISACIRDREQGIGGMNHFMLPASDSGDWNGSSVSSATRYGNFAMEHLINEILKMGGRKNQLEAKVFGGSDMLGGSSINVGGKNIEFAINYLKTENIRVTAQDYGGPFSRKVYFHPNSGKVVMKKLKVLKNDTIQLREKQYQSSLEQTKIEGDITLF